MADRTRSVIVALGANISGYAASIRHAKDVTVDFSKSAIGYAQQHEAQLNELAGTAARVGIGLVAMGGFAVKSAMDWETAWTGVLKTVDGTASELSALESELRELATSTGFAHSEVAAVAEAAGQLGVATENVASFTEVMLALGVSTNLSADEAATAIAQMANVMGTSAGDIDNLASTLVALGNDGASTEAQIIQMAQRISGAAKTVGMSEADVLAFANTVASLGIEVEAGGTAVSTVISTMAREVATGGAKLEAFARTAGLSSAQFAEAFRTKPTQAIQAFIEGLGKIQTEGGNVYGVLQEIGLSDIRVSQALIGMASAGDLLADSLATGAAAWEQNTALMAEADKFYDTTAQKAKQTWSEVKDAAIDAGDAILPVISAVLDVVGNLAEAFSAMPSWAQTGTVAFALIAGGALILAAGLMKLVTSIAATKTALGQLEISGGQAGTVLGGIGKAAAAAVTGYLVLTSAVQAGESISARSADEMSKLADELERLGRTGQTGEQLTKIFGEGLGGTERFGRDVRNLAEAVEEFKKNSNDGNLEKAAWTIGSLVTTLSGTSGDGKYGTVQSIKELDAALAQLSRNKPEAALDTFERFRDILESQGGAAEDLAIIFPSMTEVVRSASEAMGGTSDAAALLNSDLADLGPAAAASAEELAKTAEQISSASDSFRDLSAEIDGNTMSFEQWLTKLEEQAAAQAAWGDNMAAIAERGASRQILDELMALGSEGATQVAWLANASDAEFARYISAADSSAASTQALIDQINGIYSPAPINVTTTGVEEARDQIRSVIDLLTGVPGTFNLVTTPPKSPTFGSGGGGTVSNPRPQGGGRQTRAMGGPIVGPGSGTSDDVLFWGSNGEHVLRAAEVRAMGGHEGVYEMRRAAMAGAFSSKPESYTAQASSFGTAAAAPAPGVDMSALLRTLPPAVAAATEAGIVNGLAKYGVAPGQKLRLVIEG